jgi:hypothetical protein
VAVRGRSDRVIKPGQSEQVTIALNSKRLTGPFSQQISVTTNDQSRARETLICKGKVLLPFKANPRILRFGPVRHGDPAQSKTFRIARGDGGPLAPEVVPPAGSGVQAELSEITPGEVYDLKVTMTPPWPQARKGYALNLKTGIPEAPEMSLPVQINVIPRLQAKPGRYSFATPGDSPMEASVALVWDGEEAGSILGATTKDPNLNVRVEEANGQQRVFVQVPAGYEPPRVPPAVVVRTDDLKASQLRIPISFKGRKPVRQIVRQAPGATGASPVSAGGTTAPRKGQAAAKPKPRPKPKTAAPAAIASDNR